MKLFVIAFCLILASVFSSPAADVRVTGLGQTNYFPVWRNGNSVTTNSQIYQLGTLIGIGTTNPSVQLEVSEGVTTEPRGVMTSQYSTGTNGASMSFRKARGTQSAPTTVVSGDLLGALNGWVYDSANYLNMAGIEFGTTGTIAATRVPTEMRFYTATDALPSVKTLRLTIGNNGTLTVPGNVTSAGNVSGSVTVGTGGAGAFTWAARGQMSSPSDGVIITANSANTGFTTLQLGPDAATPANVSLESGNGSGTDKNGGNLQITPGLSTGAGVSGTFSVWTAGQGSTGAALNAATNRFEISALGAILFPSTITAVGTTTTQTINKPSGRVNVAAAASSVTVNNSLCTTNSLVFVTVGSNDGTATIKNCVSGTGSFVVTFTAAATAETKVNFFVINQ